MSHNLNSLPAPEFALPKLSILLIEGVDATRFMHAQSMNDVAALPSMDWQLNGWLTPQGRLIALFALVKISEERLLLVTPADGVDALTSGLQRFVFRSKVKLQPLTEGEVTGSFTALQPGTSVQTDADRVHLRWVGDGRTLSLNLDSKIAAHDAAQVATWDFQDLVAGLPWASAASPPRWTPQQLSLERWPAFSVKKGCYPGQEIVARTHFLGKGKRQLHRVRLDAEPSEREDTTVVQRIGRDALCVLAIEKNDHPASICGVAYNVLPFEPA